MSETQTQSIAELVAALAAVEWPTVLKESKNGHLNSRFADLATLINACRAPLAKQGLVVIQTTEPSGGDSVTVITTLAHKSGQWIRGAVSIPAKPAKGLSDEQVFGKSLTYARRYGYQAILSIAAEDDDDGHREARREPPRVSTIRAPFDVALCIRRIGMTKTMAELIAIGGEIDAADIDKETRDSLRAPYTEAKKRLSTPQAPPRAENDGR